MPYRDIICDVETLDTQPSSVVLSVAMVKFNLADEDNYDTLNDPKRYFYAVIDAEEQIRDYARTCSFSTIKFWTEQSKSVTKEVFQTKQQPVEATLIDLAKWVNVDTVKSPNLWGNGATFDNMIMQSLFRDYDIKWPFDYWADKDLRTLKYLAGDPRSVPVDRDMVHHALFDTMYEALVAQHYYQTVMSK